MRAAIERVEARIEAACQRSGRNRNTVKLVAVSKTFPVETVAKAYAAGLRIFGENRPQELKNKVLALPDDIEWHFIGHLQTNKIKYVAGKAQLIHSVDSMHLAQALSAFAQSRDIKPEVLVQVNTSAEASKHGFGPDEAAERFLEINELPGLQVKGLMTMAPFTDDETSVRAAFRKLRAIQSAILQQAPRALCAELSMGMSGDFEIAIEEGSTIIRVGTALFGSRGR